MNRKLPPLHFLTNSFRSISKHDNESCIVVGKSTLAFGYMYIYCNSSLKAFNNYLEHSSVTIGTLMFSSFGGCNQDWRNHQLSVTFCMEARQEIPSRGFSGHQRDKYAKVPRPHGLSESLTLTESSSLDYVRAQYASRTNASGALHLYQATRSALSINNYTTSTVSSFSCVMHAVWHH